MARSLTSSRVICFPSTEPAWCESAGDSGLSADTAAIDNGGHAKQTKTTPARVSITLHSLLTLQIGTSYLFRRPTSSSRSVGGAPHSQWPAAEPISVAHSSVLLRECDLPRRLGHAAGLYPVPAYDGQQLSSAWPQSLKRPWQQIGERTVQFQHDSVLEGDGAHPEGAQVALAKQVSES